ncbi:LLM class F420-dependent oxidoreductase [Pseudonocardia sp. WMMC193]|uniref:LLM class F420-dependent oxidoreductase n=1 Tax=Pseudonocardia sp. WMMC193 TaxID=2911965 RepID=UPI001F1DD26F|nr:LLM class F420-dependent oxidoreductase [Pseudonocardia sp. WMMC193]MCF7551783.1 LLM class F420-dependent oxidoreductase [Pseudonocardia sp. WMMC193]
MTDVWLGQPAVTPDLAEEIEKLGYDAVWLGGSPAAELAVDPLLAATERLTVGTSIVNIWTADPKQTAESFHRLESAFPGRFILGIGAGHKEATADYRKPYQALVDYLDALDDAGVPKERRALAALGPRVLELARDRSAGALPYLTTPEHTRTAREILGPDALLVAEHKVANSAESARTMVQRYLRLSNYVANLRRLGFTDEELALPGSDRVVDALVLRGDVDTVAAQLREHLAAGANRVAIQPLDDVVETLRAFAGRI